MTLDDAVDIIKWVEENRIELKECYKERDKLAFTAAEILNAYTALLEALHIIKNSIKDYERKK